MSLDDYFKSLQDFMTVNEAAAKWRVSARYVRMLCVQGKIDSYKFESRWLVLRDQEDPVSKN